METQYSNQLLQVFAHSEENESIDRYGQITEGLNWLRTISSTRQYAMMT